MRPTPKPAISRLKTYTTRTFQLSGRQSLLITGGRGAGKTALIEALTAGHSLPGVVSFLQRGPDGRPEAVVLESRLGPGRCTVGRMADGHMTPLPRAFDTAGVAMLLEAEHHPSPWVVVDEIGFLEQASPTYCRRLLALFDQKRVLAALRKADTPLLAALRGREDCLLIDLDTVEEKFER